MQTLKHKLRSQQIAKAYSANPYLYSTIASHPISVINPLRNVTKKKQLKKMKVLQYFCCEICNIDCNSKDVLERHKLGRKHEKNLEKLRDPNSSASLAMVQQNLPLIGPQLCPNHGDVFSVENPVATTADITVTAQKNRKKASRETPEDLELKRLKVVDGGERRLGHARFARWCATVRQFQVPSHGTETRRCLEKIRCCIFRHCC